MKSSRLLLVPAALATTLALAACGSSGGGGGARSAPLSKAQLAKVNLVKSDLPSGFTGKAANSNADDSDNQFTQVASCIDTGVKIKASDKLREADSQEFTKGQLDITSSASAFRSEQAVDDRVRLLKSSNASKCFKQAAEALFKKQVAAQGVTVNTFDLTIDPSSPGPKNVVAQLKATIKISGGGQSATVGLYTAYMTNGVNSASVQITSEGSAVATATRNGVVDAVSKRLG